VSLKGQPLLVRAAAELSRFGVDQQLPRRGLGVPATMVASDTDPWMSAASAGEWARRWHCGVVNLGDVGHINVASGFGPLPVAKKLTQLLMRRVELQQRQAVAA
jgi:predicted alpha/beta hydrolase family esterase